MNAKQHYEAGNLREALEAATDEVRGHPTDTAQRGFLAELLCFSGEFERADRQLDTIGQQEPQAMVGVSMYRQLIRAEMARQQFFTEGRLPEFLDKPSPAIQIYLEASIELREGDAPKAAQRLEEVEQQRFHVSGRCDGEPFDDLRDLNDLTAACLEVLTSNGKYYWIPIEKVESIELHPPKRPRDLIWRGARMVVDQGPDGEVFLPTLYPNTHASDDDKLRLGRATDWIGGDDSPAQGVGLRTFLVGEGDRTILQINQIEFDARAGQ